MVRPPRLEGKRHVLSTCKRNGHAPSGRSTGPKICLSYCFGESVSDHRARFHCRRNVRQDNPIGKYSLICHTPPHADHRIFAEKPYWWILSPYAVRCALSRGGFANYLLLSHRGPCGRWVNVLLAFYYYLSAKSVYLGYELGNEPEVLWTAFQSQRGTSSVGFEHIFSRMQSFFA